MVNDFLMAGQLRTILPLSKGAVKREECKGPAKKILAKIIIPVSGNR
jgi:hypothetical protein